MAGKPPAENTVVLQWDPSITAFASTDRIRSLVAATSQDDVQVTAVVSSLFFDTCRAFGIIHVASCLSETVDVRRRGFLSTFFELNPVTPIRPIAALQH